MPVDQDRHVVLEARCGHHAHHDLIGERVGVLRTVPHEQGRSGADSLVQGYTPPFDQPVGVEHERPAGRQRDRRLLAPRAGRAYRKRQGLRLIEQGTRAVGADQDG
jgi:hypothetical protein